MVEVKEAARDAVGNAKLTTAAASTSSYRKERRDATAKPSPPPRQQPAPMPDGDRQPRRLRCRCGNDFDDYAPRRNGTYNIQLYKQCRTCYLNKRPPKGRKSVAATGPGYDDQLLGSAAQA